MTFEGGMLKKEPYRSSLTGNSLLEGRITDRSVSCAMARRVGLCSPISGKTCFYSPRGWEVRASRPPRRKCCHSHVSRADQGPYALRGTQGCGWMKKKERMCVWGGVAAVKISVTVVIAEDLSKMASVWFTQCSSPLFCRLSYGVAIACLSLLAVLC